MIKWEIIIMKVEPWDPGHICGFQEMTREKPAQVGSYVPCVRNSQCPSYGQLCVFKLLERSEPQCLKYQWGSLSRGLHYDS